MEAIVLAGGLGTRLRSVCADRPKPMADVNGKPFLYYVMQYWKEQGVSHFILSVGYLHEKVIEYFGHYFEGVPIDYSIEHSPMGTGGGLFLAMNALWRSNEPILVLNGDTYFEVPLQILRDFQMEKGCACCLSLLSVEKNTRYGGIKILPTGQIVSFNEKSELEPCLINGGCYLIRPDFLKRVAPLTIDRPLSFEADILTGAVALKECYGITFDKYFLDIGIPEDYFRSLKKFQFQEQH
ncbi:MAG: nucleotidyltransferase family protein [Verrucomicrobia bacterium]|nr:nucleotidyltransferase family protein [Verrucomicrobiota bacterium]